MAQTRLDRRKSSYLCIDDTAVGLIVMFEIAIHAPHVRAVEFRIVLVQQHHERVGWDSPGKFRVFDDVAVKFRKQLIIFFFEETALDRVLISFSYWARYFFQFLRMSFCPNVNTSAWV